MLVQWHSKSQVACNTCIVLRLLRHKKPSSTLRGSFGPPNPNRGCRSWSFRFIRCYSDGAPRQTHHSKGCWWADWSTAKVWQHPPRRQQLRRGPISPRVVCLASFAYGEGISVSLLQKSCLQFTFLGRRLTMAQSSISIIVKLHMSGIWSRVNQPRLQRCDQHSQSTPALWFFDPNRSNIWEDVVDLMHSAYTSKVAISGIASLEFRGLAICLVLSFKRWVVIFPIKSRPFCLGIGIFLCVGLRTNPSWKENVAISFANYLARFWR